jgi:hypothetical protein
VLRGLVLLVGAVLFLGGCATLALNLFPGGFVFLVLGALFIIGIVFEQVIYKPVSKRRPGAGWQRTTERFIDDRSGKPVTVYVEPATGERAYVEE